MYTIRSSSPEASAARIIAERRRRRDGVLDISIYVYIYIYIINENNK